MAQFAKIAAVGGGRVERADMVGQDVGAADRVLAGDHGERPGVGGRAARPFAMSGRDEGQDAGADRRRDDVRLRDGRDDLVLVRAAVDRAVAVDGVVAGAVADLVHEVAGLRLQRADQLVAHVGEDDLVSALVQELGDEPAADVACAEVDRDLLHRAILS